jgi:hypothetical protein
MDNSRWRSGTSQPAKRPYQIRTFVIGEFEDFRVEFRLGLDGSVDELIFYQRDGTFVARRASVAASR